MNAPTTIDGTGRSVAAADFARRIGAAWQKSVDAIFETGRLIAEAKQALPHGEFGKMIDSELPFGASTARRLMKVAEDKRLANGAHVHVLPPSWGTLYELTKLDDAALEERIADGTIHPGMDRKDISTAVKRVTRDRREAELGARQREIGQAGGAEAPVSRAFGVIYTDDEWEHEAWSDKGLDRAPANKYPVSDLATLKQRPVGSWAARDAVLFMWSTVPHIAQAVDLMAARGFSYKSQCIWDKIYPGRRSGMGYWFWINHEVLLVGTRGDIPAPAPGTQWPSVISAPVGEHSEKPVIFHELIEAYFPSLPKLELNRRGVPRDGWAAWGNEVEADPERGIEIGPDGIADAGHLPLPPSGSLGPSADPKTGAHFSGLRDVAPTDSEPEGAPAFGGGAGEAGEARDGGIKQTAGVPGKGAARPTAASKKTKPAHRQFALTDCFSVKLPGRHWLVCFTGGEVCFYPTDRAQRFMSEFDAVARTYDLTGAPDMALAEKLVAQIPDDELTMLPAAAYRLGRRGPVPK